MRLRTDLVLRLILTAMPLSWKFRKIPGGYQIRYWFKRVIGSRFTQPLDISFPRSSRGDAKP